MTQLFVSVPTSGPRRGGFIRSALPLALIAWLGGSSGALAAGEQTAGVASDARTPSAFAGPDLDRRIRALSLQQFVGAPQPLQRRSSRDPLKNGAVIGAIAGAVGAGAFTALICHLYREEGGASCWPDALRGAAIGGAIGIGAGVAVDAALTRHPGVAVRVGVGF